MSVVTLRVGRLAELRAWADLPIALGLVMTVGAYESIAEHGLGLFIVPLGLALLAYPLACAISCIVWAVRKHWDRAILCVIKPICFVFLFGFCLGIGDFVHLGLYYLAYQREIASREDKPSQQVRFDWGDKATWALDGYQGETLIYDPTDALAAVVGEVQPGQQKGLSVITRHLVGHFYVAHESSD